MSELSLLGVLLRVSLPPVFVVFMFGAPAGLAALPYAWRGRLETAQSCAWYSLKVGGGAGLWLAAVTAGLGFHFPWLFVLPAALSAIALAHARYYRDSTRLSRYQFTIPTILYATLLTAIVAAGVNFWFADYTDYSLRNEFAANLAQMESISDVEFRGRRDYVQPERLDVAEVQFSLAGRPDTSIRLLADDRLRTSDSNAPLSEVVLYRIDRWEFHVIAHMNESAYLHSAVGINVGRKGMFEKSFPFPLRSVDDIVDHYDELVEILKTWPHEDQPGILTMEDGVVEYWAIELPVAGP